MQTPLAPLAVKFFSFPKIGMRFHASVWVAILLLVPAAPIAHGAEIISNGPVSTVKGSDTINPVPLSQGSGTEFNSLFYILPGEGEAGDPKNPRFHQDPQEPFFIAYENSARPVQSSDWWTGAGLQWFVDKTNSGWANSWNDGVIRSEMFISEPFYYSFVDFNGESGSRQPPLDPPQGLRLWNANAIAVRTDGVIPPPPSPTPTPTPAPFNAGKNIVDRGLLAPQVQAAVTVGLDGVHPIGLTKPTGPPWTKVRVRKYTDWGVVLVYTDNGNQMEITMANGSPCTWLERTQGQANFLVWAGGPTDQHSTPTVWQNDNGVLGLTIESPYNPDNGIPQTVSKAAYLLIADQGTWTRTDSMSGEQSEFRNTTATKVVVLAMPHNIGFDSDVLMQAATNLKPIACQKIVDSRIDYPPIPGSQTSVNVRGETVTLGYSPTNHRVALQLRLETQPFLPGNCPTTDTSQLLFPHQVKSLHRRQRPNIDGRYVWHSVQGPLRLYKGSSFVQLIETNGFLPFFPDQGVDTDLRNPLPPAQSAVDDIYETMRNWFYLEEFQTGNNAHIDSFVRNIGTYDNVQSNTYEQGFASLIESLIIADQLANSTKLTGNDTSTNNLNACLCKPKTQVAAEMRDYILQALKELVGHWADVYTSQFMQYNPTFNTTYGFPAGFFSVQNLSDHHFHFGYFLRAAAAIGRYDRDWLNNYLPFIDQLRKDVANYDRNDLTYPFLRNFSPYYGHSWADGTGLNGNNQESLSEATNFYAGLIELGLLLANNEWRDMGIYMYEQEILAGEQYWFNQDASLGNVIPQPPDDPNNVTYNGNWPDQFVTYRGPDGRPWHTTLIGIMNQRFLKRETFFAGVDSIYFIHTIPMSASTLYLGKNQDWLKATWQQFLLDTGAQGNPNFQTVNETFVASLQARMPASGQGVNGTGLNAALMRIARQHTFQFYGTNTMAKYWAYTNSLLGQPDTSVVADIPAYGVFKDGANSSYVAYNPTNQSLTATFKNRVTNNVVASFPVPAQSIVSKSSGGQTFQFTPSQSTPPASRLYLGRATGAPLPLIGQLSSTPGTFLPTNGTFPYPRNVGGLGDPRIAQSLSIVPKSTGNCSNIDLPGEAVCPNSNKAYAEWTGTFSGNLVGTKPFTQMTIYTDPALHTGWQQDPDIHATTNVRIEYYFNAMNQTPDRVEVHFGVPEYSGNSFTIGTHKITQYYFGRYDCVDKNPPNPNAKPCDDSTSGLYGLTAPPGLLVSLDNRFAATAPFPASVTCGKIKVQVYGQAGPNQGIKRDVPVSVGTSPLLNRASWVQPPYDGGECTP